MKREDLIYMVEKCKDTCRYKDMIEYMKMLVFDYSEIKLSNHERNLLLQAYKLAIEPTRKTYKYLQKTEAKKQIQASRHLFTLLNYKQKIEGEVIKLCQDFIDIITKFLIKEDEGDHEAQVFYLKMQGDLHRYKAEYVLDSDLESALNNAESAYKEGTVIAKMHLESTNHLKLGLALNFSLLQYELLDKRREGYQLARENFQLGAKDINSFNVHHKGSTTLCIHLLEQNYKESATILSRLRNNMRQWKPIINKEEEGDFSLIDKKQKDDQNKIVHRTHKDSNSVSIQVHEQSSGIF